MGHPRWLSSKESTFSAGDVRDAGSMPGSGRFPWRRAWQHTLVFLPGEFHGQRSLVGYSPCGHEESDMTEATEHRWLGLQAPTVGLGLRGEVWSLVGKLRSHKPTSVAKRRERVKGKGGRGGIQKQTNCQAQICLYEKLYLPVHAVHARTHRHTQRNNAIPFCYNLKIPKVFWCHMKSVEMEINYLYSLAIKLLIDIIFCKEQFPYMLWGLIFL